MHIHTWYLPYSGFIAMTFSPQNHSKFLADTIGTSLRGLLNDQVICLLQSFIYPKEMMIKRVENPPLLDENAQRFAKDLQVVQQGVGNPRDPIYELFNPFKEGRNASLKTKSPQITCIPSFQYLQIKVILDCVMPWPTWWLQSLHVPLGQTTCGTTCLRQMNWTIHIWLALWWDITCALHIVGMTNLLHLSTLQNSVWREGNKWPSLWLWSRTLTWWHLSSTRLYSSCYKGYPQSSVPLPSSLGQLWSLLYGSHYSAWWPWENQWTSDIILQTYSPLLCLTAAKFVVAHEQQPSVVHWGAVILHHEKHADFDGGN